MIRRGGMNSAWCTGSENDNVLVRKNTHYGMKMAEMPGFVVFRLRKRTQPEGVLQEKWICRQLSTICHIYL
jgi:hypothetical protein